MHALTSCLTSTRGGFAYGDLEPLPRPLKGEDLHTVTLNLFFNEFLTCNVMQSLRACLTTKGEHYVLDL